MAQQTKIEWCDDSANLWVGCAKVHHGCSNCYAESFQRRFGTPWGPNKPRIYSKAWSQTLHKLARIAEREGRKENLRAEVRQLNQQNRRMVTAIQKAITPDSEASDG